MTLEDFSRLVSGIYAAAVTPQYWEPALDDIRRTLGGNICTLIESAAGLWSIQATTASAEVGNPYAEHFCHLDYVLAGVENGPAGAVRTGTELIAPRTSKEFYHDWMRPNGIEDGLFVGFTVRQRLSCLIVASPTRTESFDTLERVKLVSNLVPHFQQAVRTKNEITAFVQDRGDLFAALEAVRHGMIIIGQDGRLINLNTAAQRILRTEDGLQVRSARIAATCSTADRRLRRALHDALNDDGSAVRGARSFVCERPSGQRPYLVQVLPLRHTATDERPPTARPGVDSDQGSK